MSSHIRKYILLTLSHAESGERSHYTAHFVVSKCRSLFNCESIIVAKELHKAKGYHYHVGILNDTASRYTAANTLRKSFPEFDGRQLNVSFHKSWNTICEYIFKQDQEPYCWGTTKAQCRERLHRKKTGKKGLDLLSRLRRCETWFDVIQDDFLATKVSKSYSSMKQLFLDSKQVANTLSVKERITEYLSVAEKSNPIESYKPEELKSRGIAVSWLVENLDTSRPLRKAQLLILGTPGSGKSTFLDALKDFLFVYEVSERKDDFSGATNDYDLWVIDEFEVDFMSKRVLNKVLDGQRVRLDSKYGHSFLKTKNVPVILATHKEPKFKDPRDQKSFDTRVERARFYYKDSLDKVRLAKTISELLEARSAPRLER